jgi:low temperature requirement protein LtrA
VLELYGLAALILLVLAMWAASAWQSFWVNRFDEEDR